MEVTDDSSERDRRENVRMGVYRKEIRDGEPALNEDTDIRGKRSGRRRWTDARSRKEVVR